MQIIAIVNEKGGTGKTTTAVNLAAALGGLGRRVLLVDLDGQAASSRWLGVEEDSRLADALLRGGGLEPLEDVVPGVSLAPASGKLDSVAHDLRPTQGGQLRKVLAELSGRYDYALIDCPPSLGNRLIGNALLAATHAIAPVEPSVLALDGLRILLTMLEDIRGGFDHDLKLIGVLACRYEPRTRLSRLVLAELRRALSGKVFRTVVRETIRMQECPASGKTILEYAPDCCAAEDYRALAAELLAGPAGARGQQEPEADLAADAELTDAQRLTVVDFRRQAATWFAGPSRKSTRAAAPPPAAPEPDRIEQPDPAPVCAEASPPPSPPQPDTSPAATTSHAPADAQDHDPLPVVFEETVPLPSATADEMASQTPTAAPPPAASEPPAGETAPSPVVAGSQPDLAADGAPPEVSSAEWQPADESDGDGLARDDQDLDPPWSAGTRSTPGARRRLVAALAACPVVLAVLAAAGWLAFQWIRPGPQFAVAEGSFVPLTAAMPAPAEARPQAERPVVETPAADELAVPEWLLQEDWDNQALAAAWAEPGLSQPADASGQEASRKQARAAPPAPAVAPPPVAHVYVNCPPGFELTGIMNSPDGYWAIVNGKVVQAGQTVGEARVVRILLHTVEMELKGERFFLGVGQRSAPPGRPDPAPPSDTPGKARVSAATPSPVEP